MRPRRFDLIAFDWDGTLFDSTAIIVRCIQDAVVDVGGQRPSDRDAAWVIGMALGQALAHTARGELAEARALELEVTDLLLAAAKAKLQPKG